MVNNYYLPWHHNFTMLIWCLSKNKNPGGLWKCFCSVGALGVHKVSFYLSWLAHLLDLQLATLFVLISLLQWWANSYSLVFIHFLARIFEPQPKVDIYKTASYTHTHTHKRKILHIKRGYSQEFHQRAQWLPLAVMPWPNEQLETAEGPWIESVGR